MIYRSYVNVIIYKFTKSMSRHANLCSTQLSLAISILNQIEPILQRNAQLYQYCPGTNTSSLAGTCRTSSELRRTNDDVAAPSSAAPAAVTNEANRKSEPASSDVVISKTRWHELLLQNRSPNKGHKTYLYLISTIEMPSLPNVYLSSDDCVELRIALILQTVIFAQ